MNKELSQKSKNTLSTWDEIKSFEHTLRVEQTFYQVPANKPSIIRGGHIERTGPCPRGLDIPCSKCHIFWMLFINKPDNPDGGDYSILCYPYEKTDVTTEMVPNYLGVDVPTVVIMGLPVAEIKNSNSELTELVTFATQKINGKTQ